MRSPDVQTTFGDLRRNLVYGFKRSGQWLYVGMSMAGYSRVMASAAARGLEPTDEVLVWHCATTKDALALEAQLINEIRPSLNVVYPNQERFAPRLMSPEACESIATEFIRRGLQEPEDVLG